MKRYILIICFACFGVLGVQGQNIGGGLSVGINTSQVDGDGFRGYNKVGLHLGGFVHYFFNDYVSLQPEISFDQLGSSNKLGLIAKMNYVTVPVLVRGRIAVGGRNSGQEVGIYAGPAFGILLTATDINEIEVQGVRRLDIQAIAGVDYRFASSLSVSFRYGYSIRSIVDNQNSPLIIDLNRNGWFNNYASISLRIHILD